MTSSASPSARKKKEKRAGETQRGSAVTAGASRRPSRQRDLGQKSGRQSSKGPAKGESFIPANDERRFQDLILAIPETVYEMDIHGRLTLFTHIERFGYTQEDLEKGFQALQLLIPEDRERCRDNIRSIQRGGDLGFSSYTFQGPHGETFPVLIHSTPIIQDGKTVGIRGLILDDSQRRSLEERLGDHERMFQAVLDAQPHFAALVRPDGRVIFANQAALERLKLKAADLIGRDLFSLFSSRIAAQRRTVFEEALVTRSWQSIEDSRDGLRLRNQFFPILDDKGRVTSVAVVGIDITSLKNAQGDLHFNVIKLSTLRSLDLAGESDSGKNLGDRLRKSLEIISRSCPVTAHCPTAIDFPSLGFFAKPIQGQEKATPKEILINGKREGTLRMGFCGACENRNHPHCVARDDQFMDSIAAHLGNLIERYQLSEHLRNRTAELVHASRLATLGEMSSCFVHEFAQPLSAINILLKTAETLARSPENSSELSEILDQIRQQVDRTQSLLRHFKRLARASDTAFVPVDLGRLAKEMLAFAAPVLKQARVTIFCDSIPRGIFVNGDRLRLEQVILNLINNACHSMRFQIRRELHVSLAQKDPMAVLTLIDSGEGFDSSVAEKLFKPFFTTKSPEEGTGLGLSICRSIVEEHGGVINAESSPGKGATFRIYLPLRVAGHG